MGYNMKNSRQYIEFARIALRRHGISPPEKIIARFARDPVVRKAIDRALLDLSDMWKDWRKDMWKGYRHSAVPEERECAPKERTSAPHMETRTDAPGTDEIMAFTQNQNKEPSNGMPAAIPDHKPQIRIRLPNATVEREYDGGLNVEYSEPIEVTNVTGLSVTGLEYDRENAVVKGTPTRSGEFPLSIQYRLRENPASGAWSQPFTFIVNPDPKKLWENHDPDPELPFWKPENVQTGKSGQAPWLLAAASRRGRSHAHAGKHRDDDFCLISGNSNGWHILAVSDGAGSAKFSREGARIAVKRASEVLADELDKLDMRLEEVITKWQQSRSEGGNEHGKAVEDLLFNAFRLAVHRPVEEIHGLAKKQGLEYRDFYATLLLCAHKTIGNQQFVAGYWIGDGAMAIYAEGEYIKLLGESDGGEYAGQTRFLDPSAVSSQENIMQRICFGSRPEISAVFLMTDGVSDPKFEADADLKSQEKWGDLWKEIKPQLDKDPQKTSENFLHWLGFWSPGNHDDRTLAMLYQHAPVPIQP
uniref:Serine/threonine protein phosphatase PrpC n=1 Tax=Candidatus Kentrum sp. MB TaxID=2138164 RepID=A0A450XIA9_9GAMM|nr:MAG: Serine/threonine protein phosphatase PrpC [Candidatus Kentron sp. MB]